MPGGSTDTTETEERERPQSRRPLYRNRNLQILFSVTLMAVLGVASISPILPQVAKALEVSENDVALLVTMFTLPGIALTPVLGILSDRIGRKKVLAPSLFLFGVAGTAVAFAPTFEAMLALRFLQGMGAAALGTINVTLIGDLYSDHERTEAMGYNASVLSVGTGSYPAIGGVLAVFGWRYPFLLPAAAIPIGLLVLFSLNNPEPKGERGMKEYAANVVTAMKNRQVAGLLAATLVTFIILYGARVTYLPILIDDSFGASPVVVGLILSSASVATALTSWQLGRITRYVSERNLIAIAFGLTAVALALVAVVPSLYLLFIPSLVFGVAQALNLPNVFSLLNGAVESENRGALLSLNGMLIRTGQTIGPILMGAMAVSLSIDGAYYLLALLPVAMALVTLVTIADRDV